MTVPLTNHSHCDYCGDPIPFGEKYCDDNCRELAAITAKTEKKKDILFYGAIAASLIAILIIGGVIKFIQ